MFKKNIQRFALVGLILLISGCNIMRAESNRDPDYQASIHRLAVVEQLGPVPFQDSFNKNFTDMARTCGVEVTYPNLAQLFTDSSKSMLRKDANGYLFDGVLSIEMTSYSQLTNYGVPVGNPDNFHYTLTLQNPDGKKVWKSLMVFAAGNVILSDKGQIFAADVIKQMAKDDLLTQSCAPEGSSIHDLK